MIYLLFLLLTSNLFSQNTFRESLDSVSLNRLKEQIVKDSYLSKNAKDSLLAYLDVPKSSEPTSNNKMVNKNVTAISTIQIEVLDMTKDNINDFQDLILVGLDFVIEKYKKLDSNQNLINNDKCGSVQCSEFTLEKIRCHRNTTNCSGRCWQHEKK
jgi:hypothetical protein